MITQQLLRAGISEESIPKDFLPAILAANEKWMLTTKEGLEYVSRLFNFTLHEGESNKDYSLIDNIQRTIHNLKPDQVHFFEGALVNGVPVPIFDAHRKNNIPPYELEISDLAKTQCECCGIVSHCVKEVLEPITDKLNSLCNYCITYHEDPRVNDVGGIAVCEMCTVTSCFHHPRLSKDFLGYDNTSHQRRTHAY